ncbi:MAG: ABC transporter permease [Bryobacteraceae bacterium]
MRLLRRLRYWLQRERFASELDEELALHRELVEREQEAAGLPPEEARRAAALQFGNITAARESARSVWVWETGESILQDRRYAWRGLSRNRSLVAIACLSIALSTGFGTTLFSVVNAVVLQPVSATAPEELVRFWVGASNRISWLNYKEICEETPGVLCAGYRGEEVSWHEGGEPVRMPSQAVTSNYFRLLGIRPAQGRLFDAETARQSRDLVVVTHAFWQRQLAGDPDVIGRKIILSGHPYTITAVLPQGFRSIYGLGIAPAFYIPAGSALCPFSQERNRTEYELLGRVPAGENAAAFRSRVLVRAQHLERIYGNDNRELGRVQIWPLNRLGLLLSQNDQMIQGLVLFAGLLLVFIVLLAVLACLNVAGLLLSRALSRQREIAVRLSLGCGKWRLSRLLFAESFLLAAIGTGTGALLSVWLARVLVAMPLPFPVPFDIEVPIDGYLLTYLAFLTGLSTIVAGLAPAIHAWRMKGIGESIRSPRSLGFRRFSTRALLTTGQVALSTVLLVATMLFIRSLSNATQVDPGFDLDRVVTVEPDMRSGQLTDAEVDQHQVTTMTRIRGLAQVAAVSGAAIIPLSMDSIVTSLEVDAGSAEPLRVKVNNNSILPEYFRVMGIPRLAGRDFVEKDRQIHTAAVIVNETFARRLFPDGGALGKRVRRPRPSHEPAEPWAEIVGVVADSRYLTLGEEPVPLVYWPAKPATRNLAIHVRTEGDAAGLAKQLPGVLAGINARVRPLRSVMAIALFPAQAAAVLLAALGLLGWALTIAGLYGVVAYSVTRRIPEIGVRVALGATPTSILRLVMREGVTIA